MGCSENTCDDPVLQVHTVRVMRVAGDRELQLVSPTRWRFDGPDMLAQLTRDVGARRRILAETSRVKVTPMWVVDDRLVERGDRVGLGWPPVLYRYEVRAVSIPEPPRDVLADLDLDMSLTRPEQWAAHLARVPLGGRVEMHPDTELAARDIAGSWPAGPGGPAVFPVPPGRQLLVTVDVPPGRVRFIGHYRDAGRTLRVGPFQVQVGHDWTATTGNII